MDRGHYTVVKGLTQQGVTILSIHALNMGAPKYIKEILTDVKREINNNTVIVGDINTPLLSMGLPALTFSDFQVLDISADV